MAARSKSSKRTTKEARARMGVTRESVKRSPPPPQRAREVGRTRKMTTVEAGRLVGMGRELRQKGDTVDPGMTEEVIRDITVKAEAERLDRELLSDEPPAEEVRNAYKGRGGKGAHKKPSTEPDEPAGAPPRGRKHPTGGEMDREAKGLSKKVPKGGFKKGTVDDISTEAGEPEHRDEPE